MKRNPDTDGFIDAFGRWRTGTGQIVSHPHDASACAGEHCVVHNPSDHSMRSFPTFYREDRGITERICPHGVGHPDPDDPTKDRVHGCDGCCAE